MAIDEDGLWTHQKFGYSIPRRNGKTEIVYILELWSLEQGLSILHTAHRISTSHSSYEKLKNILKIVVMLKEKISNLSKLKGKKDWN